MPPREYWPTGTCMAVIKAQALERETAAPMRAPASLTGKTMLEQLLILKADYEATYGAGGAASESARAHFADRLLSAFPNIYRAFVDTIEENRLLRGMAASALVTPAENASPLVFAGLISPLEDEAFDSLQQYALERGLVVGDDFTITETYTRDMHYQVAGGPSVADPLGRFQFLTGTGPQSVDESPSTLTTPREPESPRGPEF
ncbi:hypothetical protein [Paraburkholderia sp. SIMBA_054]|uniref:hypothetical protein n=1 Tax=Paraburkholderia sp. SIMBA_054 TaxID=3085795 RepID=UPI00397A8093